MYLRKIKRPKGIYLTILENYYDSNSRQSRSRTIKSLGYLEDLKKEYDDPVAFFTKRAMEMTEEKKHQQEGIQTYNPNEKMDTSTDDLRNAGYGVLKELYKQLEIDKFWNWKTRNLSVQFSTDRIFRLLVFSRILYPASKKKTYEQRHQFFEGFDGFSLDDVYHALDIICENSGALQKWIYERSDKLCQRDLSVTYFDCTNYYFDISAPDIDLLDDNREPVDTDGNPVPAKYRKRGPEKNRRPDPIVEMGLLMDRSGIPLAFDLFPGNESEKVHMRPIISCVKDRFSDTRIIFVADRGLNTSDNIYYLNGSNKGVNNLRDGYVYGQSVRGADEEFKHWILTGGYQSDTVCDEKGDEITFTHKSRIYPKTLHVNVTKPGSRKPSKKTVSVDQKQMVYYSEKYAKRQRLQREMMVERAKDLIENPKKYDRITSAGSASYVANLTFNRNTGEIVEGKTLSLDTAKIEEEKKYDGYYSIVTSELDMSDAEMRKVYKGLARIEETFKISKTDFRSRPVFVNTNDHIDAHFTTCFASLVLIRLLQAKLDNKYPVGQIINSLKKYCCFPMDTNTYKFVYYDEVIKACGTAFGKEFEQRHRTRREMKKLLRY